MTDTPEQDDEARDTALLKSHALQLAEHFESVQIVCSRACAAGTVSASYGAGNWYARIGSVREWLKAGRDSATDDD